MIDTPSKKGSVYFVGAGPGAPGLITVRGAELLKTADCIIYDKLANCAILNCARETAEIIAVPKRIAKRSFTQQQINSLLVKTALDGKMVVRLKGGDPCIFARAAEEIAAVTAAGIDFEIVPAVTAGIAAADCSGIILTDRSEFSQVTFVTGRQAKDKKTDRLNWRWLAESKGSIVFYMGIENLSYIAEQLMKNGMRADTPAAVISNATMANQRLVQGRLKDIAAGSALEKITPPGIVIIGPKACSIEPAKWFAQQPLAGKNIVITRHSRGNTDFADKLIARSANPVKFPVIKILPLTDKSEFIKVLSDISQFEWVIFTSGNGVVIFFDYLASLGKDARVFASAKVAAIGPATAAQLKKFGITADFVPKVFTSDQLGRGLAGYTNLKGKKVLLLRSQLADRQLAEFLTKAAARIEQADIYTTVLNRIDSDLLKSRLDSGEIDWITFASPSSVDGFLQYVSADSINSCGAKVASIGPVTSAALHQAGVTVQVTAEVHTIDGLIESIEKGICR